MLVDSSHFYQIMEIFGILDKLSRTNYNTMLSPFLSYVEFHHISQLWYRKFWLLTNIHGEILKYFWVGFFLLAELIACARRHLFPLTYSFCLPSFQKFSLYYDIAELKQEHLFDR